MALKVGELIALLNIDESGYIQGLKGSVEAAKTAEKSISKQFDKIGKAFVKVGKSMTKFVTLPLLGIGLVALKNAADFEKQRVAFETLLGSAKRAGVLLQQLEEFAAVTPFQLPGLIEGTKRLLAFGIEAEDVIETMNRLGDAAMGDQTKLDSLTDAFGKVAARGKASMRELNMFLYAGVPIVDALAKGFGVTTEELFKMSEQGKVTFADVNKALEDLTTGSGMFAGMIGKQSQTLSGLFSTMKDNITLLLKDIGDAFLPAIKKIIERITGWVQWFRSLSDSTKKLIATIGIIVAVMGPFLLIAGKLAIAIGALGPIIVALKVKIAALNLTMLANPIVAVIAGLAALGVGIALLVRNLKSGQKAQEDFTDSMEEQKKAISEISKMYKELREETGKFTIAQKIAKTETLLATQELRLQKAIADEDKWTIRALTPEVGKLKEELIELNNQLKDETTVSLKELGETLGTILTKDLKDAERLGRIFGATAKEVAEEKISILQSAITDMVTKGVEPGNVVLQNMIDLMRELGKETEIQTTIQIDFYQAMSTNFGLALDARRTFRELWQAEIDKQNADEKAANDKKRDDEKAAEEEHAANIETIRQGLWDFMLSGLQSLSQISNNFLQREFAALDKKYSGMTQAEKDYQTFLKDKKNEQYQTLSGEEKREWDLRVAAEDARADLEAQMEDERKLLQIKAAKRNKAFALFEAVLSGARAIQSALATPPFPVGLIMAALATTLTGLQIASILSQPIPKAIRGGLVKMIEGGVYQGRPGIDTNAVALTSGEFVMPPAQTNRFIGELEQMRKGEFTSEVNIQASPVTINLDGREIGKGVIEFLSAESDKGGVRLNPKVLRANT